MAVKCVIRLWMLACVVLMVMGQFVQGGEQLPAAEQRGYVRRGTWLESLAASRERMREGWLPNGVKLGAWSFAGPFTLSGKDVFAHAFGPETGAIDLAKTYEGGKLAWVAHPEWRDAEIISLPDVEHAAFYLTRTLTAPAAMKQRAWLGSDDGITVWLNGQRILARDVHRICDRDQEQVDLDLRAGENRLLMKISNGVLFSAFYFALHARGDVGMGGAESLLVKQIAAEFPGAAEEIGYAREDGVLGMGVIVCRYNHPSLRAGREWMPDAIGSPEAMWGWRSDKAGAAIAFEFMGTGCVLLHRTTSEYPLLLGSGRSCGQVSVAIDGKPAVVVNTSQNNGRTAIARGLAPARHRVTVTNLGQGADPARNDATVIIAGFSVDSEVANEWSRLAWRVAEAVRGGEGWRARAAELASGAKDADGLKAVWELYRVSREVDGLVRRLRDVQAEPPASIFTERESAAWKPDADARAYQERLAELVRRIEPLVARADAFRFDAARGSDLLDLMAALKRGNEEVDAFFAAEVCQLPPIVFFTGFPLRSGAAPNHVWQSNPDGPWGCGIRVFDPGRPQTPAKVIFQDASASIFDLNLSYDAKTLFFSMRHKGEQCWQIYEMGVDGSNLRQLTSGQHYNVCPVPLPDGRIAFLSSRTRGYHTVCQSGPSMHVHVMDRDGANARDLSSNTLTDFGLNILQDGRLIFTRWEYIDVNLTYRQSLWTQYPDGGRFELYFGNTIVDPAAMWQAREIPGRDALVCTFTSHHHTPHGAIGLISSRSGREAPRDVGFRWITREFPSVVDLNLFWSYRDPYPVAENRFLVSYGGGGVNRFRLCLLDDADNRTTVYDDPTTSCFYPQPLKARPIPPLLSSRLPEGPVATLRVPAAPPGQPREETVALGRFLVADVYRGLEPAVARGRVKSIRIMEQLPKTVNRTWYPMNDQGPLMGAGSYYAKRVWGYAPVEADGSAHFEAPAMKEIYFQACDEDGRELQRMTSAVQLMAGETRSCVGCHEDQRTAPPPASSIAAKRATTKLALPEWGQAGVMDYPRVVQPVLDRNCVSCHQGNDPAGGVMLSGHYTRYFNMSYDYLVMRTDSDAKSKAFYQGLSEEKPMVQIAHLLVGTMQPYRPLTSGSVVSRLPGYFTKDHCKREVSLADRRIIHEWIDAMAPYYGTQDYARREACANRDKWGEPNSRKLLPWFTGGFAPVYARRCASCHGATNDRGLPHLRQWSWVDLTKPQWSPALTAHLAKSAGGREIPAKGFEFKSETDPDYQAMLQAITEGGAKAREVPEADMPGFVPAPNIAFPYEAPRSAGTGK